MHISPEVFEDWASERIRAKNKCAGRACTPSYGDEHCIACYVAQVQEARHLAGVRGHSEDNEA